MAPTVSFCIRGWRAATLPIAIESALAQTVRDVEVVVTDDRGDLSEVVGAFDDPRLRYHGNAERLGPSWNAREALNLSQGRFIGLLNDDDRLLPTFVETVLERFEREPDAGIVFTNHSFDHDGKESVREAPVPDGTYASFLHECLRSTPVAAGTALMRRHVWEDGERDHPIPRDTAADAFIAIRAAAAGVVFSYVDEPLLVWGLHGDNLSSGLVMRDLALSLWSSFEFDDPAAEGTRLEHLADAYVGRAGARLRTGRIDEAKADLTEARKLGRVAPALALFIRIPMLFTVALRARALVRRLVTT